MLAGTPETKIRTVGHRRPLRICGIAINTLVILGKILLLRDEEGLRRGIHGRTGEVRSPLQAPAIPEPIWLTIQNSFRSESRFRFTFI